MENGDFDLYKKLVFAPSPSGFEFQAQKVFRDNTQKYLDEIRTDVHGNVIGIKKGTSNFKVMIIAHIDEIGFIVNYIDEEGFISFKPIGGIDIAILPGLRVRICNNNGTHVGIIGKKPIHLSKLDEGKNIIKIEDLWIDIGVKSKKEADDIVSIGDIITFEPYFNLLDNDFIISNASDDKAGVFVMCQLIKRLSNTTIYPSVYFVSSVQEEIGLRGAKTSAFNIEPDICIAIDVTHATDYPSMDKRQFGDIKLGKGVVLSKGANISIIVYEHLLSIAKNHNINFQIEAIPGNSGTDICEVQTSKSGVATALIGLPNRYMHTPNEMISRNDLTSAVELLYRFLRSIDQEIKLIPEFE